MVFNVCSDEKVSVLLTTIKMTMVAITTAVALNKIHDKESEATEYIKIQMFVVRMGRA